MSSVALKRGNEKEFFLAHADNASASVSVFTATTCKPDYRHRGTRDSRFRKLLMQSLDSAVQNCRRTFFPLNAFRARLFPARSASVKSGAGTGTSSQVSASSGRASIFVVATVGDD